VGWVSCLGASLFQEVLERSYNLLETLCLEVLKGLDALFPPDGICAMECYPAEVIHQYVAAFCKVLGSSGLSKLKRLRESIWEFAFELGEGRPGIVRLLMLSTP
jgi:hypothetical protein